ncbi:Solute carrier family 25 member [Fasciolopsis buskii]|uniref:Solute carrier family 25 member n=1 Tax=Fasciolopsis buskii TaxID=27845 RepID=A0A8E0RMU3_9TREM|nr:Solute carrier family 25 member [Fasciolopsis buski]
MVGLSVNDGRVELSTFHRIIASSVGGVITALIMTPLDVVKIRMQSHRTKGEFKCFIYCNGLMDHLCTCPAVPSSSSLPWYKKPGNFVGTWVGFHSQRPPDLSSNCILHTRNSHIGVLSQKSLRLTEAIFKIARNEGVTSLWSGLSPTLIMALPQTVIYFTLNDWFKDHIGHSSIRVKEALDGRLPGWHSKSDMISAFVGGASRVVAVAAICPLELLRTKMQSFRMDPGELQRIIRRTIKQEGIQSLWTGMGPTLLRDVPYSMLFWLIFDNLKLRHLIGQLSQSELRTVEYTKLPDLNFYYAFMFGATAGLVAGVLTHPFDVIKTHRQVELGEAMILDEKCSRSSWASLRRLYSSAGIRAVFAGFTPRLLKNVHASAIMIAVFETFKGYFSGQYELTMPGR